VDGEAGFAEFVAARSAALMRLAYVLTGDQHAAEDLLQSSLVRAAARWGRIHTAPEAYVRKIIYRQQVSGWRRGARRPETLMAELPEVAGTGPEPSAEARLVLQGALRALPAGKRAVLVLRYLEDLPEGQVAELLGCSVGTVRSQTHKALAQVRSVLAGVGVTDREAHR
jgi:RNA polymerase sigma-70 factor (sigma-E family)